MISRDLVLGELVEHDHVIDPVEELGPEVLLQGLVDLGPHPFVGEGLVGLGEARSTPCAGRRCPGWRS